MMQRRSGRSTSEYPTAKTPNTQAPTPLPPATSHRPSVSATRPTKLPHSTHGTNPYVHMASSTSPDIPKSQVSTLHQKEDALRTMGLVLRSKSKRVALFGNGATAAQIAPEVAKVAMHLTVFQRTPNWVIPRQDAPIAEFRTALFCYLLPVRYWYKTRMVKYVFSRYSDLLRCDRGLMRP